MNLFKHGENKNVIDGSTTSLFRYSMKIGSYVVGTRQKY
jgi:hypothetical protein